LLPYLLFYRESSSRVALTATKDILLIIVELIILEDQGNIELLVEMANTLGNDIKLIVF
jgi:hypothetical protein